ncbi:hypothetical protein Pd630_LPD16127 (plasmid) [Rhodococcus opacus PD630]|nr:hypothetical protein Pd630_LPD16127 [Rhodococcus opacus PD630]
MRSASVGASRCPGRHSHTDQQKINAAATFGPYVGGCGA